jgi:phage shock protein E
MFSVRAGLLTVGLLVSTVAAAGAQVDPAAGTPAGAIILDARGYTNLSVSELRSLLDHEDVLLVNVHIPFEGDLPATDLSIPYNEIERHRHLLPLDPGAPIVLYCRSGRMSEIAALELVKRGFSNVYHLAGGFIAWAEAGLPVEGL